MALLIFKLNLVLKGFILLNKNHDPEEFVSSVAAGDPNGADKMTETKMIIKGLTVLKNHYKMLLPIVNLSLNSFHAFNKHKFISSK